MFKLYLFASLLFSVAQMYGSQPVLVLGHGDPPAEASIRARYAEFLETVGESDQALLMWRRTLELDPGTENAHYGIAHILFDKGDFSGCVIAADTGLLHSPKSSRLYLAKTAAQERLGLWYDARRTLQQGSLAVDDESLLRRYAETEDQYGRNAGLAYQKAALSCEKNQQDASRCSDLMDRGFAVSLRDSEPDLAEWFAAKLRSIGRGKIASLLGNKETQHADVRIPGGMAAVLMVIGAGQDISGEDFLRDFSRTILPMTLDKKSAQALHERIAKHFALIKSLEDLGRRDRNTVYLDLSLADEASGKRTRKVLKLLGWEMREAGVIEPAEGSSAAARQATSAALAVDEIEMQRAFNANQTFRITLKDDWVPAVLGETIWRDEFYGRRSFAGEFTEALSENPELAKLYVGISEMDASTAGELVKDFGLKTLHDKWANNLYQYSADLVVREGRALVPGGKGSESIWRKMTGENPSTPRQFFRELLKKDNGKMLAFFSCLMQVDVPRQKFFLSSATRTLRFYELFRDSPEIDARNRRNTPFQDFITQVPLDINGHILFPGSPEVWMVARGQSGSEKRTAGLLKKASRIASPEVEDEILLRMARTAYSLDSEEISELADFLAVVHVEAHRHTPLDEASALLLAQEHARHRGIWSYLTGITGLTFANYTQLFGLHSKFAGMNAVRLNEVMGEFNAVAKLLCLMQEFGRTTEKQTVALFGSFCERLNQALSSRDFAAASLNAVQDLIKVAAASETDPDIAIRNLLIKKSPELSLTLGSQGTKAYAGEARRKSYQAVLEAQKVPAIKVLVDIQAGAENLASGKGDPLVEIKTIYDRLAAIPEVEIPKSSTIAKNIKESFRSFMLREARKTVLTMSNAASKNKVDRKRLASLAQDLMEELNPQVRLALTGVIYAYYLNPKDLLISEDPGFLRRHQFVSLDSTINRPAVYAVADLRPDEQNGAYLLGGFGNFGLTAGMVSMATNRQDEEYAKPFAAAVLGSLRDTDWQEISVNDLRLVGLRIRAAREWVLRSASETDALEGLSESLEGLLSAGRRVDLLRAISRCEWNSVWKTLSFGDLFFLGEQYPIRYGQDDHNSPTVAALKRFSEISEPSRLQRLGPEVSSIFDCSHTHLLRLSPFESYENLIFADKMASRSNEFKLYLAELFDRAGFPAALLEDIAEPIAGNVFAKIQMTGPKDWRSVIRAYRSMDERTIESIASERW